MDGRDSKGRFMPGNKFRFNHKPAIDIDKIRNAYIAGLNDQGGVRRPSQKVEQYLKSQGFI